MNIYHRALLGDFIQNKVEFAGIFQGLESPRREFRAL